MGMCNVEKGLKLFDEMRVNDVEPDEVTMIGMVASCAQLGDLDRGVEFRGLSEDSLSVYTLGYCIMLLSFMMLSSFSSRSTNSAPRLRRELSVVTFTKMRVAGKSAANVESYYTVDA